MNDFTRPEYAPYVALCRKLAIPIPVGEDGYATLLGSAVIINRGGEIVTVDWEYEHGSQGPGDWVWLPSLSDWLEMLMDETESCHLTLDGFNERISPEDQPMAVRWLYRVGWDWGEKRHMEFSMSTPEEALAYIWAALNKEAVS